MEVHDENNDGWRQVPFGDYFMFLVDEFPLFQSLDLVRKGSLRYTWNQELIVNKEDNCNEEVPDATDIMDAHSDAGNPIIDDEHDKKVLSPRRRSELVRLSKNGWIRKKVKGQRFVYTGPCGAETTSLKKAMLNIKRKHDARRLDSQKL